MQIIKFYNREKELSLLEKVKKPFFCIIYGRRRVGKTSLVLNFLKDKDFVYFFVNPKKSENMLLEEFTQILLEKGVIKEYFRPKNWEEFFKLLFENYQKFVIFDEFQWFLDVNKSVPYILQKYWDISLKKPSIILTGSIIGMVKDLFEKEGAPFFKRADVKIKLKPFEIHTVFEILNDLKIENIEEKFKLYLLFGGLPYYYSLLRKYSIRNVEEAIKNLVLSEHAPLRNEVEEILVEAFKREYKTYLSILFAIAEGKTKIEEIASYAKIKPTSLMPYIYDLMNHLELIEKQRIGFKKKHVYEICDFFHRFWLRYVYKYSTILEYDEEAVFARVKKDLNSFFGKNFEIFVRELIRKYFSLKFEKVMKYIGFRRVREERKVFDIDILALNEHTKQILFAECKWQDNVNALKICKELANKASYVDWHNEQRREYFAIFAKSFSKKIDEYKGRKVFCYDLNDKNFYSFGN